MRECFSALFFIIGSGPTNLRAPTYIPPPLIPAFSLFPFFVSVCPARYSQQSFPYTVQAIRGVCGVQD